MQFGFQFKGDNIQTIFSDAKNKEAVLLGTASKNLFKII
jgi:hypothetical protein